MSLNQNFGVGIRGGGGGGGGGGDPNCAELIPMP